jgi:hypothetical protein
MVAEIGKTTTHLLAQHSSLFLQDVPTAHPMYVRVETAFSPQPQARIADLQAVNLLALGDLCAAPAQAHLKLISKMFIGQGYLMPGIPTIKVQ